MARLQSGPLLVFPDNAREDLAFQTEVRPDIGTYPAGSQTIIYTTPGDFYEVVISIFVFLTTDANVAQRYPEVSINGATGANLGVYPPPVTQGASTVRLYTWSTAAQAAVGGTGNSVLIPFPTMVFSPGFKIRMTFNNTQATDVLTSYRLMMLRIPTGPQLEESAPFAPLDLSGLGVDTPLALHG